MDAADVTIGMDRAYDAPDERVRELLGWIHGPDPVFTDARKLKDLSKCTTFVRVTQQINEVFGQSN